MDSKNNANKNLAKPFAYTKNEYQKFLRYPFAETEFIGKLSTPGILKTPQPEYRRVFEMNKYQEIGVRI